MHCDMRQHMIEKTQAGGDIVLATAIQVQIDLDTLRTAALGYDQGFGSGRLRPINVSWRIPATESANTNKISAATAAMAVTKFCIHLSRQWGDTSNLVNTWPNGE